MILVVFPTMAQQSTSGNQSKDTSSVVGLTVTKNQPTESKKDIGDGASKEKKPKKDDLASERDRIDRELKNVRALYDRLQSEYASMLDSLRRKNDSLLQSKRNEARLEFEKKFVSRPQTRIINQVWSTGYMTEDEVVYLIPEIKECEDFD